MHLAVLFSNLTLLVVCCCVCPVLPPLLPTHTFHSTNSLQTTGEWLQQLAHLTQLDVSRDSDVLAGPHPTAHVVGLTGLRDLRLRLQHKAVIKVRRGSDIVRRLAAVIV